MKKTKTILFSALAVLAATTLLVSARPTFGQGSDVLHGGGDAVTLLCVGLDDAAQNTDVMLLITLDPAAKTVSLLQIPRDTYCRTARGAGKINAIYPTLLASGCKQNEALSALAAEVSDLFGVRIDDYAAIDIASLAMLVDRANGVTIRFVEETVFGGRQFTAGAHRLDGEALVSLIRHRASYAEGDIGRLDAQKLILGAAYRKLKSEMTLTELAALIPAVRGALKTSLPTAKQISLLYAFYRDRHAYSVRVATLPGEAVLTDGLSYYAVNRAATLKLFEEMGLRAELSREGRLSDPATPTIHNIYIKSGVGYTVYTEHTLDSMKIKSK